VELLKMLGTALCQAEYCSSYFYHVPPVTQKHTCMNLASSLAQARECCAKSASYRTSSDITEDAT
jgi:hypothetical protein